MVNEYLAGKRKSYVSPIKLYFFVSLFTFFLFSTLVYLMAEEETLNKEFSKENFQGFHIGDSESIKTIKALDSVQNDLPENQKLSESQYAYYEEVIRQPEKQDSIDKASFSKKGSGELEIGDTRVSFGDYPLYSKAKSRKEFDSIHKSLSKEEKMSWMTKSLYRKAIELEERGVMSEDQFQEKFTNSFKNNFPRVLIFYLPVFAFILWVLHGKKRWKYYDHGVFTLYFFSFLLLLTSIILIFDKLISIPESLIFGSAPIADTIGTTFFLICFMYAFFYFFRSHSRIYGESKFISRLKSLLIFGINFFLFMFSLLMFTMITFLMI